MFFVKKRSGSFDGYGSCVLWKEKLMGYEEILSMSEALEITEISREKVSDPEEREKEDSDLKERRSRERRRVKKSEKGWIFGKLEQQGSFSC